MRAGLDVLVIAYEFPPVESAQGLRWWYLCKALAARGHTVRVLRASLGNAEAAPMPIQDVEIISIGAGPFVGGAAKLAACLGRSGADNGRAQVGPVQPSWPERAYRFLRRCLDHILVPDVRSEWYPFARARLFAEIRRRRPDWIIGSHEPGVDLALASRAGTRFGIPWLADLGDPVDAAYTPRWRHWVDRWLESRWLRAASLVTVTTEGTQRLLELRHPATAGKIHVLTQGFDPLCAAGGATGSHQASSSALELLYTGTLYPGFRHPGPLLAALEGASSVRLRFAGYAAGTLAQLLEEHPAVSHLGRMPHALITDLQRRADVLVNLGNLDPVQQPGKLIEYLGARRPILHIYQHPGDPAREWVEANGLGWAVPADPEAITEAVQHMVSNLPRIREPLPDPCKGRLAIHAWPELAAKLERLMTQGGA